jgi:hypothetical protein
MELNFFHVRLLASGLAGLNYIKTVLFLTHGKLKELWRCFYASVGCIKLWTLPLTF